MQAKQGENFYNYFSSLQSNEQHFLLLFHEQTVIFPEVSEQTNNFPLFAEKLFFHQKSYHHTPTPPKKSNGGPLFVVIKGEHLFSVQ